MNTKRICNQFNGTKMKNINYNQKDSKICQSKVIP